MIAAVHELQRELLSLLKCHLKRHGLPSSSILAEIAAVTTVAMLISIPAGVKASNKPAKTNVATQCQREYSMNRSRGGGNGDGVPREGLEPTPPCGERILSPPRLPFRHLGKK